ncbi:putative transporter small subunit [Eoetvoesiella caeni]
MTVFGLTAYILIWPVLSAVVLLLLLAAFAKDVLDARKNGGDML